MKLDKHTLLSQLERLTRDSAGIQAAIAQFQKEVESAQAKIRDTNQSIERHQGALNYNGILLESIRKDIEALEKEPSSVPTAKPDAATSL